MKYFKLILSLGIFALSSRPILSCEEIDSSEAIKQYIIPLRHIGSCGDGFNIEGGKLAQLLSSEQKWLSLCMPLDRPFIDEKTLEEITKDNTYPLKESNVIEYNESRVYLALLLIIDYYKNTQPGKRMLIQNHRNSSSFPFLNTFSQILASYYKEECSEGKVMRGNWPADPKKNGFPSFTFSNNFYLEFLNGYEENTLIPHSNFSFIFSLSLMGGLKFDDPSGTLTLPTYFVPFDVDNNIIDFCNRYECKNQLINDLDRILGINQSKFFPIINLFKSPNPKKQYVAQPLLNTHFRRSTTILQISRLYNPIPTNFETPVKIFTKFIKARL